MDSLSSACVEFFYTFYFGFYLKLKNNAIKCSQFKYEVFL